nr:glycosyltransferase [Candidatus Gracilibacteria bacterium]
MKKIFFLINSLEGGGAERVIVNISEKLSETYDITIITLKNTNFFELSSGVKHIALSNIKNNFLMFLLIPFYIYKFKKLLKKEKFVTGMSSLEISNFVNILSNKNAIIAFETNIGFFQSITGYIYKLLIKVLYPIAKKIKVNSEENKYHLAEYLNIELDKIFTIYNPIDIEKIEKLKNEVIEEDLLNKIKGKQVFITVGRLIKSKYHKRIINSFSKIKGKNWIYLIIGDGLERKKLEELVNKLGLEKKIIFLGSKKNVFKYLNISNFFLYASKIEGFPNVLGEAMACNLPIITSNFVSGATEIIIGSYSNKLKNIKYPYYGDNGVLIDLDNYENYFLEIYNNLNKIKQIKTGFEKFNIKKIEKDFENILFN